MLKEVHFYNWKSFKQATLYFDPLTVLIGSNASGKSNALEGLQFLQRLASGKEIETALHGDATLSPMRGGVDWAVLKPENQLKMTVLMQGEHKYTDYFYSLSLQIEASRAEVNQESLTIIRRLPQASPQKKVLFQVTKPGYNFSCLPQLITLSKIKSSSKSPILLAATQSVVNTLQGIFILDPMPTNMRGYSPLSEHLNRDASNIAGVLAALPAAKKADIEATLAHYLRQLPEQDVRKIWAEPVGRLNSDAMLYCEEVWGDQRTILTDARTMSDGTLRFLAILTALLIRPPASQLVIEEIDNGLHPSRLKMLLQMLVELSQQRKIDVLVTTHNPVLLDHLVQEEMMPFIVVAHRHHTSGEGLLTLLDNVSELPNLLQENSLGNMATQGKLETILNSPNKQSTEEE